MRSDAAIDVLAKKSLLAARAHEGVQFVARFGTAKAAFLVCYRPLASRNGVDVDGSLACVSE